ncbi:MAG: hypothetical protein ABFC62_01705, partial [Clostridiaceae bacterium]
GKVVADDKCESFFFNDEDKPWHGTPESIRNRTNFVNSDNEQRTLDENVKDFFGGYPAFTFEMPREGEKVSPYVLRCWATDSNQKYGISPAMWHDRATLYYWEDANAGSTIYTGIYDLGEKPSLRPSKGRRISDFVVSGVYWADLSIADNEECISEGELVVPNKEGFYILILVTDYGCFSRMIKVA